LNQAEVSLDILALPSVSELRQQQIDWCLRCVNKLDLPHDCSGRRVSEKESNAVPVALTRRLKTPLGHFTCNLYSGSNDTLALWCEYWDEIVNASIESVCNSIVRNSSAIVGFSPSKSSTPAETHYFSLTGSPADAPVILSISVLPDVGFKPTLEEGKSPSTLRIKPQLRVGRTAVSIDTFGRMKVGGLLVLRPTLDERVLRNAKVGFLEGRDIFSVNWHLDEGTIVVSDTQRSSNYEDNEQTYSTDGSGIDVPIFAQIELRSIELDQLKALKQEDVLLTDMLPKDAIIKLSAGGISFGEGSLVQLDERLAVRITKLYHRGA
jgi:flagellar motor switch/type III secretory pathway protein FliN